MYFTASRSPAVFKQQIRHHKAQTYKELADYNKRNAFDVEKYRQHKLVVKPDDTFDLYDMGEVDAD